MRWMVVLLAFLPAAAAAPYAVVEDAAADQAAAAPAKFDIQVIEISGDAWNITVNMTMGEDVRGQRGQHAVGMMGGSFHVHVACAIGQTHPAADDPQQCGVANVTRDEGQAAAVVEPFQVSAPSISADGRTWSVTFPRGPAGIDQDAWTDRIYGQSKLSFLLPGGEASPGAMGHSEADAAASTEPFRLGASPAVAPVDDADPEPRRRTTPTLLPLLPLAALALARR